jgi:hypothetical protein
VIAEYLETFLASLADDPEATGLPASVQREFYDSLRCGSLAHGLLRLGCDTCKHELLLPFSGKRQGCPSCAARRMAQTATHLVEQVLPWVPTRYWVASVPIPLRYWTASSPDLTTKVHTIIRPTIAQYYVNQAIACGVPRGKVHPGSVTFIQRFGSALTLHVHSHLLFLEGVYLDCTDQGLQPRFLAGEPPTDTAIAAVLQKIRRRVIRMLRRLGYLEAGLEPPVATRYDPLRDTAPELARTMAASVQQRLAWGERAGQQGRRIGSGFGAAGEAPRLTGPRCTSLNGFALHANTQIPAHRRDQLERSSAIPLVGPCRWCGWRKTPTAISSTPSLIRGRTAPRGCASRRWNSWRSWQHWSPYRTSTLCAMGVASRHTATCAGVSSRRHASKGWTARRRRGAPRIGRGRGSWGRVFHLEMVTCPLCQRGALRLIAVITQGAVIRKILRHLKRAADPPSITPARSRQEPFDWVA